MKTSILQLEPHDDVISTRDKMGWSQSARILLVWPRRGRILRRKVDLVLLKRRAQELGGQLALVTRDREVQMYAGELGISCFATPRQAQSQSWRTISSRPVKQTPVRPPVDPVELRRQYTAFHLPPGGILQHPAVRILVFLTGMLSAVMLVLFFYPGARVELDPQVRQQAVTIDVRAAPEIPAVNASGGLPAEVSTVVVEAQAELATTGQARVADSYAQGAVQFSNLTDQAVTIPAGAVVRTLNQPAVRFETLAPVSVPAGPGQLAEAQVRAVLPGLEGNVPAGQVTAVEGDSGLLVSVANLAPLEGGGERSARAPSAGDEARLREQLLETLRRNALDDLARMGAPDREVLPASLQISRVISEEREPPASQPADRLRMTMRVEFTAWMMRAMDARVIAQAALGANLPGGFQAIPETLHVERIQEPVMDAGQARWQIRAVEQVRAAWTPQQVAGMVMGKTPAKAQTLLARQFALASAPRITLRPAWWVRMPFIAFRIEVVAP